MIAAWWLVEFNSYTVSINLLKVFKLFVVVYMVHSSLVIEIDWMRFKICKTRLVVWTILLIFYFKYLIMLFTAMVLRWASLFQIWILLLLPFDWFQVIWLLCVITASLKLQTRIIIKYLVAIILWISHHFLFLAILKLFAKLIVYSQVCSFLRLVFHFLISLFRERHCSDLHSKSFVVIYSWQLLLRRFELIFEKHTFWISFSFIWEVFLFLQNLFSVFLHFGLIL